MLAKKRKASEREAEVARAVAAVVEAVEVGGRLGSLRIGSDLMPTQRHAAFRQSSCMGLHQALSC